MGRKRFERRRVGDLPTVEGRALAISLLDDDALLAVVHAERQGGAAAVDELHAEETAAVGGPILQALRANAHIPERLNIHRELLRRYRRLRNPSTSALPGEP